MGKADILQNMGEGRYRCRILYNRKALEDRKTLLESAREKAAQDQAKAEEAVATCQTKLNEGLARLDGAIDAFRAEASEAGKKAVSAAQSEVLRLRATLHRAELRLGAARLVLGSVNAELERLRELLTGLDQDVRELWCADHSLSLSDTVDTLEINGEPGKILLAPGTRHTPPGILPGMLTPIPGMTAAQTALNWVMLPGWQKWKPTFRTATLLSRNLQADTGCVTLDADTSSVRGLSINQEITLTDIPIEYMACNAKAFEEGDRVVIEFRGQKREAPVIIGFEDQPRPCPTSVLLRVVFHRCALYWDVVNDDFADIPWQAPEGWKTGDPWPEGWPDGWNYGPPTKWQMGDPWPYTRHLKRVLQYDDDGRRLHFEMEQGHRHFMRKGEAGQSFTKENRHQRHHPRETFKSDRTDYHLPGGGNIYDYRNAGTAASWKKWSGSSSFRCAHIYRYSQGMNGGEMDFILPVEWDITNEDINLIFEETELHPETIILRDARSGFDGVAEYVMWNDMTDTLPECPPGGAHTYAVLEETHFELRESFIEHNGEIQWPGGSAPFGIYWKTRRDMQQRYKLESGYHNVINMIYSYTFSCNAVTLQDLKVKSLTNLRFPSGMHPLWDAAWATSSSRLPHTAVVLEHLRAVSPPPDKDEEYLQNRDYGQEGDYHNFPTRSLGTVHSGIEWGPVSIGVKTAYSRARRSSSGYGMGKIRECQTDEVPHDGSLATGYTTSPWLDRQLKEMMDRQPPERVFLSKTWIDQAYSEYYYPEYWEWDGSFKGWKTGPAFKPGEGYYSPSMMSDEDRKRLSGLRFLPVAGELTFVVTVKDFSE